MTSTQIIRQLFIDEAYALAKGHENDFGKEAIDVLVKAMEDHRGELVVILAGYEGEMNDLLNMNPGLESRIPFKLSFPDYSVFEIIEIVKASMSSKHFTLTTKAENVLVNFIQFAASQNQGVLNGNARWARNLVEKIRMEQNNRIARTDSHELMIIETEDIENAAKQIIA